MIEELTMDSKINIMNDKMNVINDKLNVIVYQLDPSTLCVKPKPLKDDPELDPFNLMNRLRAIQERSK